MTIVTEFIFDEVFEWFVGKALEILPGADIVTLHDSLEFAYRVSPFEHRTMAAGRARRLLVRWRLFSGDVAVGVNGWIERAGLSAPDPAFMLFEWNLLHANHTGDTTGLWLLDEYPLPVLDVRATALLDEAWGDLIQGLQTGLEVWPLSPTPEYVACFYLGLYGLRVMETGYALREVRNTKFGLY